MGYIGIITQLPTMDYLPTGHPSKDVSFAFCFLAGANAYGLRLGLFRCLGLPESCGRFLLGLKNMFW